MPFAIIADVTAPIANMGKNIPPVILFVFANRVKVVLIIKICILFTIIHPLSCFLIFSFIVDICSLSPCSPFVLFLVYRAIDLRGKELLTKHSFIHLLIFFRFVVVLFCIVFVALSLLLLLLLIMMLLFYIHMYIVVGSFSLQQRHSIVQTQSYTAIIIGVIYLCCFTIFNFVIRGDKDV